jgi:hypothetical protein
MQIPKINMPWEKKAATASGKQEPPRDLEAHEKLIQKMDEFDPGLDRLGNNERMAKYVDGIASHLTSRYPNTKKYVNSTKGLWVCILKCVYFVAPLYWWFYTLLYTIYKILPKNILRMIFGLGLCFLGGHYWASLAAIEAARQLGGDRLIEEMMIIVKEVKNVKVASRADDKVDANKDGIADVDQITAQELMNRKIKVAMLAVSDPRRLQNSVGFLWTSWISVLMTLRFEFARYVAIGLAFVEMIEMPFIRILTPFLMWAMGGNKELAKWVPVIVTSTLSIIAFLVANALATVCSAFYSALRGGTMFATGLYDFLLANKVLSKCKGLEKLVKNPDDYWFDELIGYVLAGVGFWYQLTHLFALPDVLGLPILPVVFAPLELVEWFLKLQILQGTVLAK